MPWTLKGVFLYSLVSSTVEETIALGETIADALERGSIIALRGGLGAGKTCLVQGIARGLGITEQITSPTYTIVSEYTTKNLLPFYHIDAYRLGGDDDFANLGGEEFLYGGGITVIEWSERIAGSIPAGALTITIEILEDGKRRITVGEKA